MKNSRQILWLVAFWSLLLPSIAAAWPGKVVGVTDGDTITILHDRQAEKIRLWGIDFPERRQHFGNRAKQATSALVFGKIVDVDPITRDRYVRKRGILN